LAEAFGSRDRKLAVFAGQVCRMSDIEQKPPQNEAPDRANHYPALLAGLIHKLNNVATVITGNAGLLLMDDNLPDHVRNSLEQMSQAIEQLARILHEAEIASKEVKLNIGTVDVAAF
jgi:hypothetical protein